MSEANKALAKRWFEEVWNEGRRETIRELLAPEAVIQEGNDASVGPEGFTRSSTVCKRRFRIFT